MNVLQEIASWAKKLPPWQSDALRRIFISDSLSASDESEILAILLAAHNIRDEHSTPLQPIPFSTVMAESADASQDVLLQELHSLSGVNALVQDQSLKFALDGVTVIYGENAAGKSGYARVLKHACHAREKGEPILSDVTKSRRQLATATIELSVGGENIALRWSSASPSSDVLTKIAVFDAHCARVFIDEANEVVYLPYGLDVFGKLAALCKSLKDRIAPLISKISQRFAVADEFSPATEAGRFIAFLTAKSDLAQLDALIRLDEAQVRRLRELRALVSAAMASGHKQSAARLRRLKTRFDQLRQKVVAVCAALSSENLRNLRTLKEATVAASKAAELASTSAFANEPIHSTGSEAWRLPFDAAKAFSQQDVYLSEEFPVTRDGAVCVLCQQSLGTKAVDRFRRFKEFVSNDAAHRKADAEASFRKATAVLEGVDVDYLTNDTTLIEELRAHDETLAANVEQHVSAVSKRRQSSIKALSDDTWHSIPEMPTCVAEDLRCASAKLEATALEFDKADKPEELRKLQEELRELEDCERLAKRAEDVRAFIRDKMREASLRACEKALDTTAITRVGSEIMERAVTEQLAFALETELEYSGVSCAPLKIRKSGESPYTFHGVLGQR